MSKHFYKVVLTLALVILLANLAPNSKQLAQAQTRGLAVLTVKLRDAKGDYLSGVQCEVLSYDWGLKPGQPYSVIAQGETDKAGEVKFDVTVWPRSGYRFRFTKTSHTQPADTFFESRAMNQFRGDPAAVVGGTSEVQRFTVGNVDGLVYNDTSKNDSELPNFSDNSSAGLEHPRGTVVSAEDFKATVEAKYAGKKPQLPIPPAPTPRAPQVALPSTVQATATSVVTATAVPATTTTTTTSPGAGVALGSTPIPQDTIPPIIAGIVPPTPPGQGRSNGDISDQMAASSDNGLDVGGLLIFALTCGIGLVVVGYLKLKNKGKAPILTASKTNNRKVGKK